jgi:hypothetical protein
VLAEEVEIAAGLRQRGERMWPTPTTMRGITKEAAEKEWDRKGSADLRMAVHLWPTPTVCGNYNRKGASASSGDGLATAVTKFQTPNTNGMDGGSNSRKATLRRGQEVLTGGSLNPTWVEWLMGWPLGWTDLKPLATGKSPSVPQQHSNY